MVRFYDPRFGFAVLAAIVLVAVAFAFLTLPREVELSCAPAPGPVLHCRSSARSPFGIRTQLREDVTAGPGRQGLLPLIGVPPVEGLDDLDVRFEYRQRGALGSVEQLMMRFGDSEPHPVTPWLPSGTWDVQELSELEKRLERGQTATFAYRSGWGGWVPALYFAVLALLVLRGFSARARVSIDPEAAVAEIETRHGWLKGTERHKVSLDRIERVSAVQTEPTSVASSWQVALVCRDQDPLLVGLRVGSKRAEKWAALVSEAVGAGVSD